MNLRPRHGIAALALALTSVAAVPAFAQSYGYHHDEQRPAGVPIYAQATVAAPVATPVYVAPAAPVAQPVYVVQQPAAPFAQGAIFAQRTRERMNQIEREARVGVARGQLRGGILGAISQERAQVEGMLARTMRDGIVRPNEARRIELMLGEMNQLSAQFQMRNGHRWGYEHQGDRDGRGPFGNRN